VQTNIKGKEEVINEISNFRCWAIFKKLLKLFAMIIGKLSKSYE
jgi:hypothetical protein